MLKINCTSPVKNSSASGNKNFNVWRLTLGLAVAVMLSPCAMIAGSNGTSVMHLITQTDLSPTGVDSNARGKINVTMTRQGETSNQEVKISVVNLDPNTTYGLIARIGNTTVATGVTQFTTDRKGAFSITYMENLQGKSGLHAVLLPVVLNPMCNVRELSIINSSLSVVLRGLLTNPNRGNYLVDQPLYNPGFLPGANGTLSIQAGPRNTTFLMRASGLAPRTVYGLAINGSVIDAVASDKSGALLVRRLPLWVPDVLDIHMVALTAGNGSNVVLSADGLGVPCDTVAPIVISTSPVNMATNAPINSQLMVAFSEAMDSATITNTTFILQQGAATVGGTVSYVNGVATFSPITSLITNTLYTATITTGVKNLSGYALASSFVWSFTTSTSTDNTLPTVSSTIPTNTATGVAINSQLAATFSKVIDPATITNSTFTLQQGSTTVTGVVSYANGSATFAPAIVLVTNALYTATITTGAMDLAGNALATNFVWSFTTSSSADTNAPIVLDGNPTDMATNVAVNQTLNATFNKDMNPATINTNNFIVTGPGATNVAGTVTYLAGSQIGTFTPATNLAPDTTYTNTVTTGAMDLAGNPLATNVVWIFTTGSMIDTNLMSIPLGAASTFAVMATAAISGGADQINGDVGLSPGSAQGIPPSEINGTIHINDQAITDAQTSLMASYSEAVNRSANAQTLEGNLGGLTKTPGLYVNGSSTGISGTGANAILTLDAQGDANAVFVFKMASTLVTDSGTSIVLAGGAQAKNVYWQVGSSATLGTTSSFQGNILAFVSITVKSGTTVNGRLFAGADGNGSGAVTIQSSTVTVPAP